MNIEKAKINLKVFLINKAYYEFRDKTTHEVIDVIKNNHLKKMHSRYINLQNLQESLEYVVDGDFELWSYCYNHPKDQSYWKLFLPDTLSQSQNFQIVEFSYVLFLKYNSEIYCVIGGSGINVIKKYLDTSFGIELYQHFAKPQEDILVEMNVRGIASNISKKGETFNLHQTISESLEYSEIPTKIKIILREELKQTLFQQFSLGKEKTLLEVGAYFNLRKSVDFTELKELIRELHKIRNDDNYTQLTLFRNVKNEKLIYELDETLKERVVDDIIRQNPMKPQQQEIIEIVHPSKLEKFYECNDFIIRLKYSRDSDNRVDERTKLYNACTNVIYNNLKNTLDRFEVKKQLYLLNIKGCIDDKEVTHGIFFDHIVAELDYRGHKYFRIDSNWYFLEDRFIEQMNIDAQEYYTKYHLEDRILNKWLVGCNEDTYNLSHNNDNYYILDKVIKQNIEICDILVIKDNKAYFIHVKDGFNTKMRDLYIQIVLSAKRLSNDLKDSKGGSFLKQTLRYYNQRTSNHQIDIVDFLEKVMSKELEIIFVMAYNNTSYKGSSSLEKIQCSKSNIAKYSIVQTIKDMARLNFSIKLIDISELE